jgi:hypothetical protein
MTNKLRQFTRLFAIPFLILWWIINLIGVIALLICCICDLRPDEFEFCIEDLFGLLKHWIKNGTDEL